MQFDISIQVNKLGPASEALRQQLFASRLQAATMEIPTSQASSQGPRLFRGPRLRVRPGAEGGELPGTGRGRHKKGGDSDLKGILEAFFRLDFRLVGFPVLLISFHVVTQPPLLWHSRRVRKACGCALVQRVPASPLQVTSDLRMSKSNGSTSLETTFEEPSSACRVASGDMSKQGCPSPGSAY